MFRCESLQNIFTKILIMHNQPELYGQLISENVYQLALPGQLISEVFFSFKLSGQLILDTVYSMELPGQLI